MTPFHNMALMSPATTAEDVDKHTAVLEEAAGELMGGARPKRPTRGAAVDFDPEAADHLVGVGVADVR